jgi:uncharacterized membrane protein YedE/YeeE
MRRLGFSFLSGALFGAGLTISQMVNPRKVTDFLDFFGHWDPSLAFVMGGALTVAALGFRVILRQPHPLLANEFHLPSQKRIDARLLGGSALFGIGWGLAGFCPGPAVASLAYGLWQSVVFVAAMVIGMLLWDRRDALIPVLREHGTQPVARGAAAR